MFGVARGAIGTHGYFPKDERDIGEAFDVNVDDDHNALGITMTRHENGEVARSTTSPGFLTQLILLFEREVTNLVRDTTALGARFGLTIFLSTLIGIIFRNVADKARDNQTTVQSTFGALIMVLLMSMFGTAQPALLSFPAERPVFLREYSTNHYSVVSYFISRLTIEAVLTGAQVLVMSIITYFLIGFQGRWIFFFLTPYALAMASTALAVTLGCSVEDPKLAQEMLPILFVPQMLFAGFFVAPDLIPVWLRWARYLCTLTYAVRILLVEEFQACADAEIAMGSSNPFCSVVLINVSAKEDETWWNWLVLVALFGTFRLLALSILRGKATKFY